jgi:LacI family transcriptional regulator
MADPAPPRRVTLRDIAQAAGTTTMTVSNVLNGRNDQVGGDTARRVLAARDRLGYRPLAAARQLRAARRMAVGVVIVDPSPYYLSDPFTAALLAGLNERLAKHEFSLILHGGRATDLASVPMLRHIESDGICVITSGPARERKRIVARIAELGQPVVVIQDLAPAGLDDSCAVLLDDEAGAEAIGAHLAATGAKRTVMLVPEVEWPAMARREAGMRRALERAGASLVVLRCPDEGFEATQATLARHVDAEGVPDALAGGNDRMALAALQLFAARGIDVPARVRVTGFNGFENHLYARPALTTVSVPAFRLGEEAAAALVERLKAGRFAWRKKVLPVEFAPAASSHAVPIQQGAQP